MICSRCKLCLCVRAGTPRERGDLARAHAARAAAVAKLLRAAFAPHLPPESMAHFGSSISPPSAAQQGAPLAPREGRRDRGKARGSRGGKDKADLGRGAQQSASGAAEQAPPETAQSAEGAKGVHVCQCHVHHVLARQIDQHRRQSGKPRCGFCVCERRRRRRAVLPRAKDATS